MHELLRSDDSRKQAAQLRFLRLEHGLTEEKVAEHLGWSPSKMNRIETGRRDETTDDGRNREAVSVLDCAGFPPDEGLRPSHCKGSRIRGGPKRDQLRARTARLATPRLESMLVLPAIPDEAVLHRVMGCGAVMGAQLEQIIRTTCPPNVTLRVIPFNVGAHPAMSSTISILESIAPCPVRCILRGPWGAMPIVYTSNTAQYPTNLQMRANTFATRNRGDSTLQASYPTARQDLTREVRHHGNCNRGVRAGRIPCMRRGSRYGTRIQCGAYVPPANLHQAEDDENPGVGRSAGH